MDASMPFVTDSPPRVVGLLPEGISDDIARQIALKVRETVAGIDGSVVRALRIIPSSLSNISPGVVQFVANTTVEPKRSRSGAPAGRSKVIDSVVTVEHGVVGRVSIPFLEV